MKNIFSIALILLPLFTVIGIACVEKPARWPANGTKLQASKYRLEPGDSSKILIQNGEAFTLLSPPDSLIVSKFTIEYSAIGDDANEYFRQRASQMVTNTSNPEVIEYYSFSNGNVLFLGYSNANAQKSFICFEPPLIIASPKIDKEIESSGVMKTFIKTNNAFDEGENTVLLIKRINKIDLKNANTSLKTCHLQEIIIKQDASVAYGENKLIIPDALSLSTKLLLDQNGIPLAEWSLKSELIDSSEENQQKQKRELFIEFTKYNRKTE